MSYNAIDMADKNPVIPDKSTTLTEAVRLMRKEQISRVLVGQDNQHVLTWLQKEIFSTN